MKSSNSQKPDTLFWVLLALCLVSFVGHLFCYPSLPDTVPSHWDGAGNVNGHMPKTAMLLLDLLPLALLLFMQFLPRIEPKKEAYTSSKKAWPVAKMLTVVLIASVSWTTEFSVWGVLSGQMLTLIISAGVGLLFLALGNYMPQVARNYTFGVKTPWALNDEHNWQRTQRMGGITFMILGAVMLVAGPLGLALGANFIAVVLPVVILGGVGWLYLYSYLVFAGKMK